MLSSCGQQRLWSDWADAQVDLSLRWVHMPFCWFCHEAAQLVCACITFVELLLKFYVKVSQNGLYRGNRLSESIYIWVMSYLEGLLSFHKFWPKDLCPGGGGEGGWVKNWDSLTKCYTCTSLSSMLSKDIGTDISHPFDIGFHEMMVRVVWFIVQWFCQLLAHLSWRLMGELVL